MATPEPSKPPVARGTPQSFGYQRIKTFEDGSVIWEAPDGVRVHWPKGQMLFRLPAGFNPFEEKT